MKNCVIHVLFSKLTKSLNCMYFVTEAMSEDVDKLVTESI